MKTKSLIVSLLFFCLTINAQDCPPFGLYIYSQSDLDNYAINYPGCKQINGSINIKHLPANTDLSALSNIETVAEELLISDCGYLDLSGFKSLKVVGTNLRIENNGSSFSTLKGLDSLKTIGRFLLILFNPGLQELSGLNNLESVAWTINISRNQRLKNLGGLANLHFIGQYLGITNNDSLSSLKGLNSINTIGKGLDISYNKSLLNLEGLEHLDTLGGFLQIAYNEALLNFSGLSGLHSIGKNMLILNNDALISLMALDSLTYIGEGASIAQNWALPSLDGLNRLSTIGNGLDINSNHSLKDLTALYALSAIHGPLSIGFNDTLMSLTGLDNIDPNSITNLTIKNSGRLTYCHVPSICNYLANPANPAVIELNFPSCYSRQQVEMACAGDTSISATHELLDQNIKISPNPTTGIIDIKCTDSINAIVKLTDCLGRLLATKPLKDTIDLDINNLPNGLYFLLIETKSKSMIKRIVKI